MRPLIIVSIALGLAVAAVVASPTTPLANADGPSDARVRPQRIVSLNLCSDQLVLALADRHQIAGLTRNANNREMSAEAGKTAGIRILSESAEEILEIDPDLLVGMPARRSAAFTLLKDRGYRLIDFESAKSFDSIVVAIRETAAAVGYPSRGEALIAQMRRDLAAIPRTGEGKVAAYYQRRGFMTGTGTLIDEAMTRVGFVNLAAKLGKPRLSRVSLEEMAAAQPDYLIVESATDTVQDQGTEMLHHPALRDIPRISIPQAWTVCGSPAYVKAVRAISQAVTAR